eukprot:2154182-Prymnesium_polylepis.1
MSGRCIEIQISPELSRSIAAAFMLLLTARPLMDSTRSPGTRPALAASPYGCNDFTLAPSDAANGRSSSFSNEMPMRTL